MYRPPCAALPQDRFRPVPRQVNFSRSSGIITMGTRFNWVPCGHLEEAARELKSALLAQKNLLERAIPQLERRRAELLAELDVVEVQAMRAWAESTAADPAGIRVLKKFRSLRNSFGHNPKTWRAACGTDGRYLKLLRQFGGWELQGRAVNWAIAVMDGRPVKMTLELKVLP